MSVIFIAGVYGVGKSTVCDKLSESLNIPHYSASDIISKSNGEKYGRNKAVSDANSNQNILINEVEDILKKHEKIILSGHFCIFDKNQNVIELPTFVYEKIYLEKIILLEKDLSTIVGNLSIRDDKKYISSNISELQKMEKESAVKVSKYNNVPLYIYELLYSEADLKYLINMIGG